MPSDQNKKIQKQDSFSVSICMITYNHEKFVAEAIESVLKQKTTFPIELVIGDDKSTDSTPAIIKGYAEKYPGILKVRYNKENAGVVLNTVKTIEECSGKYIAMLEGDDYWTDPLKLQKQVDFLEKNPDFACSFHNVMVLKSGKLQNDDMLQAEEV